MIERIEDTYDQIPKMSAGNYRVTIEAATLKRAPTVSR